MRYWKKILGMGEDRLVKMAYEADREEKYGSWSVESGMLLEELGLGKGWREQDTGGSWKEWAKKVDEAISRKEKEEWEEECQKKVKLEGYRNVKKAWGMEPYLKVPDQMGRCLLDRLRGGTHWLMIETGRWKKEARKDRICRFCGEEVEDEGHFLR